MRGRMRIMMLVVSLGTLSSNAFADSRSSDDTADFSVPSVRGTRGGNLVFSGGGQYTMTSSQGFPLLYGSAEYQITNVVGLRAGGGIPLGKGTDSTTVFPGGGGLTIHMLARSRFDPFIGAGGGLAIVSSPKNSTLLAPMLTFSGGGRIYLSNLLFLQLEAGYQFLEYSGKSFYTNLNAPFVNGQGGFYL